MNRLNKYAEHFIKIELIKANIEVFQNESGREGVNFIIKTKKENYHELYLQSINLEKESNIKILKENLKEPNKTKWIALVLVMKNMDSSLYLIPSSILLQPKNHSFISEKNPKKPYWEINVFLEAIPELTKYALNNIVDQL
jgi:hypothetical protein